jgi:hypothetical protein
LIFILSASNGLCGLSFKVYFRVEMQLNEAILSNKYSKLELSLLKKRKLSYLPPNTGTLSCKPHNPLETEKKQPNDMSVRLF